MAGEHLELLGRIFAAFNRRDVGAFLACFHDDAEFHDGLTLGAEPYCGHEQIARWFTGWDRSWDRVEARRWEASLKHDGLIVANWVAHARGRTSGIELEQAFWGVLWFHDDRVQRLESYATEADALAAADRA